MKFKGRGLPDPVETIDIQRWYTQIYKSRTFVFKSIKIFLDNEW